MPIAAMVTLANFPHRVIIRRREPSLALTKDERRLRLRQSACPRKALLPPASPPSLGLISDTLLFFSLSLFLYALLLHRQICYPPLFPHNDLLSHSLSLSYFFNINPLQALDIMVVIVFTSTVNTCINQHKPVYVRHPLTHYPYSITLEVAPVLVIES